MAATQKVTTILLDRLSIASKTQITSYTITLKSLLKKE